MQDHLNLCLELTTSNISVFHSLIAHTAATGGFIYVCTQLRTQHMANILDVDQIFDLHG
jgi:hypothetical protein